jgi:hypothetical protein
MAARNIRPRVLSAVYELGTFTISELCRTAGLTDRDQAYSQLKQLKQLGFVEHKTLRATGAHAPLKQYRLVSDETRRAQFTQELTAYRITPPDPAESELAKVALEDAEQRLSKIERTLTELSDHRPGDAIERLDVLAAEFETAKTNLETAKLEYGSSVSAEVTPGHPLIRISERWRNADARLKALRESLEGAGKKIDLGEFARAVARGMRPAIFVGSGGSLYYALQKLIERLALEFGEAYRAPMEVLFDEIRADPRHPFTPVFRNAVRTSNRDVLFDVFQALNKIDSPWWRFNVENACYLKTSKLHTRNWLKAYASVRDQIQVGRDPASRVSSASAFKVYSYALEKLTEETYLDVTKGQCVSLVSPSEIGFLGASEIVRPTLLSGSTLKSLNCTFLDPNDVLHTYGPIANEVVYWQGAPGLRVAACLGMWGLPLGRKMSKITAALKEQRGLLILQGKPPELAAKAAAALQAKEIGECVGG